MPYKDTIYALSTPYGKSGIAIIKISGPNALKTLQHLNFKKHPKERVATLGKIYNKNLEIIDEIIVIYFSKNNSYTGEETLELQTHGGMAIINSIFNELSSFNFLRIAQNGEFTRTALENNKISLNKAESLIELINAESEFQRKIAIRNYNGELEQCYLSWRNNLINLLAISEAYIDFPDDLLNNMEIKKLNDQIKKLINEFNVSMQHFKFSNKLMTGINICIAGQTNVGKSTLMNFLSKADTSIISDIQGTTRDVVKTKIEISGIPVILHDIAGIRETSDKIENIGIKKGKKIIKNADILIIMLDANNLHDLNIFYTIEQLVSFDTKILILINKNDLLDINSNKRDIFKKKLNKIFVKYEDILYISLINNKFHKLISNTIIKILNHFISLSGTNLITNIRHQEKLEKSAAYLNKALKAVNLEIKSEEIRYAAKELGAILGEINSEEIFNKIFSSFCIGK
ncbi:tRNA uridine-5-carboxymethylaminomethyl(34) synthesis GTPase MnmE [Candidatus Aquarickettsia rohweri]|uniref:tRNA modification GTPase MnmE n=1 Tax=Candidatus Aquarickettsia rohweri TaxID=2602574 RepID=A0A3R9YDA5_9RICK|nr:tRNA uridine-5-carboxymethylaminomethyl(34) synthesis GTPase MnmE [Candidatus Aquarickettsia rohweri]RST72465.1 tRNA uridine-5-carboxymethylaminomethyl(34) synthesis GTPase MnmE [Candidatus Aquarickettsia rohweri]